MQAAWSDFYVIAFLGSPSIRNEELLRCPQLLSTWFQSRLFRSEFRVFAHGKARRSVLFICSWKVDEQYTCECAVPTAKKQVSASAKKIADGLRELLHLVVGIFQVKSGTRSAGKCGVRVTHHDWSTHVLLGFFFLNRSEPAFQGRTLFSSLGNNTTHHTHHAHHHRCHNHASLLGELSGTNETK